MTRHWACTRLTTLPDPTKSVWEQDAVMLELLVYVDEQLMKEADRIANERSGG